VNQSVSQWTEFMWLGVGAIVGTLLKRAPRNFWFHKMCCQERFNYLELVARLFCLSLSTS